MKKIQLLNKFKMKINLSKYLFSVLGIFLISFILQSCSKDNEDECESTTFTFQAGNTGAQNYEDCEAICKTYNCSDSYNSSTKECRCY